MKNPTQNDKCFYDNKGQCNLGNTCKKFHPRRTCQNFSKYGKCNKNQQCKLRHPIKFCFDWKSKGSCFRGELCRFRHPHDYQKPFLWKIPNHTPGIPPSPAPFQFQPPVREMPLMYAQTQPQPRIQQPLTTSQPLSPWINNWLQHQSDC